MPFAEEKVDRLYVDAAFEGDVMLCPGDRSYIQLINRDGFKDVGVANPHESLPFAWNNFVALAAGRVARPVT